MRYSGRRRTQEPSFIQIRPFFGCFIGTLSPSRRHRRSTLDRQGMPACPRGAFVIHLPVDRQVVFTPPRGGQRLSTRPQPAYSHIDRTGGSARSCLRANVPRQHALVVSDVVWIDVGPRRDICDAQKSSSDCVHDQYKHADAKGSEVSRCGLL